MFLSSTVEPARPDEDDPRASPCPVRVALADDHLLVREGLRRVLGGAAGIEVVAEAADGQALLAALATTPVDVVVLDLSMPGLSGVEVIERIGAAFPRIGVLVLTMHGESAYAAQALRAGARGYVTKGGRGGGAEVVRAVRDVARGAGYVDPSIAQALAVGLGRDADADPQAWLSPRERQVLRLLARGERLVDIARALGLSVKTVSTHKTRIQDKLAVHGTAGLTRYAIEHRLIDDVPR